MTQEKLAITGASGKLGRLVVSALTSKMAVKPEQLILITRRPEQLREESGAEFDIRQGSFEHPETLQQIFQDATSVLLISIDAIGERETLHKNAILAAEKAGVSHLVYTSMPNPDRSPVIFAHEHLATERAIASSTIPTWSILRNNWYFENLIEAFPHVISTETWVTSAAQGRSAQLSRRDLARAAAAALIEEDRATKIRTLNGPSFLTVEQMADQINTVIGSNINVVHLSDEALANMLSEHNTPEEVVKMTVSLDQHNREELSAGSSKDFVELTGVQPQSFAQWVEEHAPELWALRAN